MWEKPRSKPPDAVFSRGTPPRAMFGARDLFLGRDEDVGGADMLPSVPYTLCENPAGRSVLSATAGLVGPEIHRVVSAPEASAGLAPMWMSAGPQRTSPCPRALARRLRLPGSSLGRLPTSCTCAGSRPHSPRTKWQETGSQRPKSPHGRITWPRVVSPSPRALAPFGRQSVPGESAPHLMCLNFVVGQSLCALWLRFTWRGRETLLLKAVVH